MASRRKKPKSLSDPERERFMKAATEMHRACCDPLLRTDSDDYRALRDLNQQVCEAIRVITEKEPPWAQTPPARQF